MLAADNYAGHSTFSALHCHNDYCRPSVPKGVSYEKASFVLYSMDVKCTLLRFSNDYNYSLLIDLAVPDDIIHIRSAALLSSFQVFVPHCSHSITQLLDN
jgi:hypothetical protein